MNRCFYLAAALSMFLLPAMLSAQTNQKLKALIVDGQNNHKNWPETTPMMKKYLTDTGRFTVDVATTMPKGTDPAALP